MLLRLSDRLEATTTSFMAVMPHGKCHHLHPLLVGLILLPALIGACGHVNEGRQLIARFHQANELSSQGNYQAALVTYQQVMVTYPGARDRVLFEMGMLYAHPGNQHKAYQQALACFQQLIKDFPESRYRKDSEVMVFTITNTIGKDQTIATQHAHIEDLQHEITSNRSEAITLQNKIVALEQALTNKDNEISALNQAVFALQKGPIDKILVEKQARRLTLILKGTPLKTYQIALGGNPDGPKERQGDNKTPEGLYRIDARNSNSRYHLSLHISYPNEHDRKRAKKLAVSPGGDIMIHGIKNGLSLVGDLHSQVDWTKGCIAVTDEEIEEIARLAPNGTIVEIRP